MDAFVKAVSSNNTSQVSELLAREPQLKTRINDPVGPFDSPAIIHARSREMLDLLLKAGANINTRSQWWAGSFGLLDTINPDLAAYAIERGAIVDVHSAARLGMIDKLKDLVAEDPARVQSRGGDGQTPLHFAKTIEIAKFLLEHGAEIDALDVDHESTPAQYMVRDRQEIVRFLVERGCRTDLLMAAAIGDERLVRKHLDADPDSVRVRVSEEYFPKKNPRSGGMIYQWTLGAHLSAHDVAKQFGHDQIFALLMERGPVEIQLLAACWNGEDEIVKNLVTRSPEVAAKAAAAYGWQLPNAARNNNVPAVRLMLEMGASIDARGQHGATALHWAGFHGNFEMARELLRRNAPLEAIDNDFKLTPVGWAVYGSENGWYCRTGSFAETVDALLQAGATPPKKLGGTEAVKEVLRRSGVAEAAS
jgi:ankyrin repeat protein